MLLDLDLQPWNERLLLLRKSKKWSQREAADECGAALKAYWLWEQGKCYPRRNSRIAIVRAYKVNYEDIFGDRHND
jgi:Predicted transcriptional regulators